MLRFFGALLTAIGVLALPVQAADWPTRPVTLVVPFTPGGMADVSVRMLADPLQKVLGQPLVVENKGGAGGLLGLQAGMRAEPDGYTMIAGGPQQGLVASLFLSKDKSKAIKASDMLHVGGYMPQARVLFVPNDSPFSTWEEFLAYAKANPRKVSIGFGGSQWSLDILRYVAAKENIELKLVLYKSGGDTSADFFGGHITVGELGVGTAVYQAAREGKAKVLLNLSDIPIPGFETAPGLRDKGYTYTETVQYSFAFPKGTPKAICDKFENALKTVLADKAVVENMRKIGFTPAFIPGAEMETMLQKDLDNLSELVEFNAKLPKN